MPRRVRIALAGLFLVGAAGCAPVAPADEPPPPAARAAATAGAAASPAAADPAPPAVVPAALRFTGKTIDGAAFDGGGLAGKPAVLWFWAPFCATCAGQAPTMTDLTKQYGDRVGIVGVAGLGSRPAMREFITDTKVEGVRHLDDGAGAVWRRFGIVEQSVFVILDADGNVLHKGWLDSLDLTRRVEKLAA
ncbi:hypothetical protein GCM10010123_06820 [Pilimelia anulata]|uniref:Thioredoxin domain-containing protein n=1 Tax=Pilimelia anulata TaxID=53371 RepID=A0A8J3FB16_9ACTN|nr:redoxin family protein [Pilimelia anulata]GGJ79588.1 hypothetical protein GCM10010123_06820 [Pilimelia anulata]